MYEVESSMIMAFCPYNTMFIGKEVIIKTPLTYRKVNMGRGDEMMNVYGIQIVGDLTNTVYVATPTMLRPLPNQNHIGSWKEIEHIWKPERENT